MPDDRDGAKNQTGETTTLNLILHNDSNIFVYPGNEHGKLVKLANSTYKLRETLVSFKEALRRNGQEKKMVVLMKPTELSNYKTLVDCLDEIQITGVPSYVLMDPEKDELELISSR